VAVRASNELLQALGAAIRSLRLERGMTQEGLAEGAGLHTTYVSDVERGRRNIGVMNLDRLANALSVDLPTLMGEAQRRRSVRHATKIS
jgi:transcriptional regulator with XRE-family HTH domain